MKNPFACRLDPIASAPSIRRRVAAWVGRFCLLSALPVSLCATVVIPPEFPDLVNRSDFIVRAVVKSVDADFAKPGSKKIVSRVTLEVREVIAGHPPEPLVLRMLGGKIGNREMDIDGAPVFQAGDENILFVHGNGQQFYPLVGMMHGVYPIRYDASRAREFVTRSDHRPLRAVSEVSRPLAIVAAGATTAYDATNALTPAEFAQLIRTAVKSPTLR